MSIGGIDERAKYILVDFAMVYDTDFGSIKYMLENCKNTDFFKCDPEVTDYFLHCEITVRKYQNPLTVILKEEYNDQADSLFKELQSKHWSEVLKQSPSTEIATMLAIGDMTTGYAITINCRNEEETKFIKKIEPSWENVIDCDDASKYFCMYIHDMPRTFNRIPDIEGKCIYILYEKPNFLSYTKQILKKDIVKISPANEVSIISRYKNFVIPKEMMPKDSEVEINGKQINLSKE